MTHTSTFRALISIWAAAFGGLVRQARHPVAAWSIYLHVSAGK